MDSRKYPCLPVLYTKGSHYDVGYNIGVNFSQNINRFLAESESVNTKVKPFYDTNRGRELYSTFLKAAEDCYPQFVLEIRGMSDGSGIPFDQLFLLNMSAEIKNILYIGTVATTETEGCSDILLNSPDLKLIVHNEDCDPLAKPYGYMVSATIDDADGHEQFMSYCYPGTLPGNNFTVNGSGMIITINGLYPDKVTIGAPSRYFLNRSIIRMTDITDGKRLAENAGYGSSYAFCANIASINDPEKMYAIEIGNSHSKNRVHVHTIPEGTRDEPSYYFRCNKYKHLDVDEGDFLSSSKNRTKRASEFPKPKSLKDVLEILGDTHNQLYPIYRTPRKTDAGETVNTTSFDIIKRTVGIYYENPKYAKSPFLTLPLDLH